MRPMVMGLVALALMAPATSPAEDEKALPAEAAKRLEHIIGTWDCRWDYLDAEGNVAHSATGTENARWAIEGRVVEFDSEVPEQNSISRGLMFYSFRDERFHLTSVDQHGAHWHLSGSLDEWVITSIPVPQPNGKELIVRFTHSELKPDSFEALMEYSVDDGQTWKKGFREYLTRR